MATTNELGLMSSNVYANSNLVVDPINAIQVPAGWSSDAADPILFARNDATGFLARAYVTTNAAGQTEVAVAFGGTTWEEVTPDWWNGNVPAATGLALAPQLLEAAIFYLELRRQYGTAQFTLTGHSMGGGFAAVIAVLFDEAATVFDPAPFGMSADSAFIYQALRDELINRGYGDDAAFASFAAYQPGQVGTTTWTESPTRLERQEDIQTVNAAGEALTVFVEPHFRTIEGSSQTVLGPAINPLGEDGWGPIDQAVSLHSMTLLNAYLQSPAFLAACNAQPWILKALFNSSIYPDDQTSIRNNLWNLLMQRQVVGEASLDRLAADALKILPGGLSDDLNVRSALYDTMFAGLYSQGEGRPADTAVSAFVEVFDGLAGGVRFDLSDTVKYDEIEVAKVRPSLVTALQGYASASEVEGIAWQAAERWTVQTGAAQTGEALALNAISPGDDKVDFVLGGARSDTIGGGGGDDILVGGLGADVLLGDAGADTLHGGIGDDLLSGGSGNDVLKGGTNFDTYTYSTVDDAGLSGGTDVIIDSDGRGRIIFDGMVLSGGSRKQGETSFVGGSHTYSWSGGTLLIDGVLAVQAFNNGNLQINLFTEGTAASETIFGTSSRDFLAGLEGRDILRGLDGDDVYYFAPGWNLDGIFDAGSNEIRFSPDIDPEHIYVGRGSDNAPHFSRVGSNDRVFVSAGLSVDAITRVEFADGTVWDASFLANVQGGIYFGGTPGDDTSFDGLTGDVTDDILDGFGGNDVLNGHLGDDLLYGGPGNDTLFGGGGTAVADADTLNGGTGSDLLEGGLGDDTYEFALGDGQDRIWDPGGADTIRFLNATPVDIFVNRNRADAIFQTSMGDSVVVQNWYSGDVSTRVERFEFADGTVWGVADASTNTLTGTEGADFLGSGNDDLIIRGLGGNDVLSGGRGNDFLDGGAGADTMNGGFGDDFYVVDAGDWVFEADGEGIDTIQSTVDYNLQGSAVEYLILIGDSAVVADGNNSDNILTGNSAANSLFGYDGNDTLDGGAGADTMTGGLGDDTYIVVNAGDVEVENASEGIDMVQSSVTHTLAANVENLTLTGNSAINGTGNALANELRGNSAANTLAGGAGDDSYYVGAGDTVTEASNAGTDTVFADATYTLGNNIENLTLLGTANINGTGNALANILRGNSGVNALAGGTGNDQYHVSTGDTVTEANNAGTDTVFADVSWTLGTNIERLTLTGTANINATGNTLANTLTGNSGDNVLNGGTGADTMIGGAGNDRYVRDVTGDVVTELANEGIDTVESAVTYTLAANVENLTLTGTGKINGTGNALNNVLTGNAGTNALTGLGGDDTYFIATGDTVTEAANAGEDLVNSSITHTLANNVENLILTGTTALNGTGNTLNNLLRGNSAVNTLAGAAGNDVLEGGDGNDTLGDTGGKNLFNGQAGTDTLNGNTGNELLIGGAGNDTVNTSSGADIIAFNRGDGADTVALSTVKDNSLSLGGGIAYADLFFQKSGTNLILKTAGAAGAEQITFTNWYAATANRSVLNLQMVVEASADFDAGSADPLRNRKVAEFNFDGLVSQFDAALAADPGITSWALTNALTSFHLGGNDAEALGGDLAYRYGLQGNLAAVGSIGAQNVLAAAQFGTAVQAFQAQPALEAGMMRLT